MVRVHPVPHLHDAKLLCEPCTDPAPNAAFVLRSSFVRRAAHSPTTNCLLAVGRAALRQCLERSFGSVKSTYHNASGSHTRVLRMADGEGKIDQSSIRLALRFV